MVRLAPKQAYKKRKKKRPRNGNSDDRSGAAPINSHIGSGLVTVEVSSPRSSHESTIDDEDEYYMHRNASKGRMIVRRRRDRENVTESKPPVQGVVAFLKAKVHGVSKAGARIMNMKKAARIVSKAHSEGDQDARGTKKASRKWGGFFSNGSRPSKTSQPWSVAPCNARNKKTHVAVPKNGGKYCMIFKNYEFTLRPVLRFLFADFLRTDLERRRRRRQRQRARLRRRRQRHRFGVRYQRHHHHWQRHTDAIRDGCKTRGIHTKHLDGVLTFLQNATFLQIRLMLWSTSRAWSTFVLA